MEILWLKITTVLLLELISLGSAQDLPVTTYSIHTHTHTHTSTSPAAHSPTSSANVDIGALDPDSSSSSSSTDHNQDPYVYCYIVLIAGFFVALALLYWVLVTRSRTHGPAGRADSLASWFGHIGRRRGAGCRRWRDSVFGLGREEGLDENGEAPPPYRPQASDVELGKPPSYGCADHYFQERPPRLSLARVPRLSLGRSTGPSPSRSMRISPERATEVS